MEHVKHTKKDDSAPASPPKGGEGKPSLSDKRGHDYQMKIAREVMKEHHDLLKRLQQS